MNTLSQKIEDATTEAQSPRPHLGISMVGQSCARRVWYAFRFYKPESFSGRILRLFRRGAKEEDLVCDDLAKAGHPVRARQKRVHISGHVSGSIDGIIEWEGKEHLLEIKTHNKKSFDDLEKNGVEKSKPQHYTQMQLYMAGLDLTRAWYYAVCKDDDRIYTERVKLDQGFADDQARRAVDISLADTPPPRISDRPEWYECKMCPVWGVCHAGEEPQKGCRSCAFSSVREKDWYCNRWSEVIPFDMQKTGCDEWRAKK